MITAPRGLENYRSRPWQRGVTSVSGGPCPGGRRGGRLALELVDSCAELLPGSLNGVWITGPVGPVRTDGASDLHGQIRLSEILQDLHIVIILNAVPKPFQAHRCDHAFDPDRLARIHE